MTTAKGASVRVEWSNGIGTELNNLFGTPLSSGTSAAGDGFKVELGYYSFATTTDPFAGSWLSLSGSNFSIGDKGVSAGLVNGSSVLNTSIFGLTTDTPLSIRFYDSTAALTATYFNVVSNNSGTWNWKIPTDPQPALNITLSDAGIVWQDGVASAFRTTIPIPEPSSVFLFVVASSSFLLRRRKK